MRGIEKSDEDDQDDVVKLFLLVNVKYMYF